MKKKISFKKVWFELYMSFCCIFDLLSANGKNFEFAVAKKRQMYTTIFFLRWHQKVKNIKTLTIKIRFFKKKVIMHQYSPIRQNLNQGGFFFGFFGENYQILGQNTYKIGSYYWPFAVMGFAAANLLPRRLRFCRHV